MYHENADSTAVGDVSCYAQHGGLSDDQLHENELTNCALAAARYGSDGDSASIRPVAAARPALLHGWHASPHGGTRTLRTSAAAPRLTRLAAMPRLAPGRHTTPGGGGTPCPAAHASHGGGARPRVPSELT